MNKIYKIDKRVSFGALKLYKYNGLNTFFKIISSLGDFGMVWLAIAIALISVDRTSDIGEEVLMAIFWATIVGQITIKSIIRRKRPCHTYKDVNMLVSIPTDFSFPSGHTSSSFACAIVLFQFSITIGIIALLFSILMGISRVYLFVHYLSDVIAGAILGIIIAIIIILT